MDSARRLLPQQERNGRAPRQADGLFFMVCVPDLHLLFLIRPFTGTTAAAAAAAGWLEIKEEEKNAQPPSRKR